MRFGIFLAVAAFFLLFFGLGSVGLMGPDEPRYAQVAREMARSGDYITPRLNGEPWLEKPPLYYWLAAASFRLFGVSEWAARLPAALFGAAFLALFGWVVGRLYRGETSRYALLLLASSAGWFSYSRGASPEILFTASLAGALAVLALWVWIGRDTLLYLFYALLALAVLSKGPTAILLAGLVLFVYCLATREFRWLLRVLAPWPVLVFLVLALPWYVALYVRSGDRFVEDFIIRQHFRRFATQELAHPGPWWYYLPILAALVFPWTAHLSLIVAEAVTRRWSGLRKDHRRVFLLAWIVPVVAFFSLSKGKLPGYVLMTLPALAIWMGNQMSTVRSRWLRWVFVAQAAMFPLVLPAAQALPVSLAEGARAALQSLSPLHPDRWLAGLTGAGAVLIVFAAWRGRRLAACLLATALMAAALSRVIVIMAPAVDSLASARPLARLIQDRGIPPSQLVLMPGVHRSIEYGLGFYLDYRIKLGTAGPYLVTADGRILPASPRQEK